MKTWKSLWTWGLKVCPACGSFSPLAGFLCGPCENQLIPRAQAYTEIVDGLTVRFLFRWNPGESDSLSNLVIALKGPFHEDAWKWWAKIFAEIHGQSIAHEKEIFCVSAPARADSKRPDHSYFWAKSLSETAGLSFRGQVFAKSAATKNHRRMGRDERRSRKKLVKKTECFIEREAFWVMADDILTTGGTARAIYEALEYPEKFEVWCLAYRTRPSCDP